MTGRCTRFTRAVAVGVSGALATAGVIGIQMASAPAALVADQPVSANASPMWQTNNSVQALAVANGVVYAGGDFTRVRPPNTATGAPSEVVRNRIAAFNANTGNLVTKVVYLPFPQFQDLAAVAGGVAVVSTTLEPGINPVDEANRRGTILAVIRLGNIDLQDPNTPAMDAPGAILPGRPVPPPPFHRSCRSLRPGFPAARGGARPAPPCSPRRPAAGPAPSRGRSKRR